MSSSYYKIVKKAHTHMHRHRHTHIHLPTGVAAVEESVVDSTVFLSLRHFDIYRDSNLGGSDCPSPAWATKIKVTAHASLATISARTLRNSPLDKPHYTTMPTSGICGNFFGAPSDATATTLEDSVAFLSKTEIVNNLR